MDGNSTEAKAKRLDLIEAVFATRSWTAIESLNSQQLREGFAQIKKRVTES